MPHGRGRYAPPVAAPIPVIGFRDSLGKRGPNPRANARWERAIMFLSPARGRG